MTMTTAFEDPLDILEDEARAVALCFGTPDGEAMASALVSRIITRMAGTNFYVPTVSARQRRQGHVAIRQKFNGTNVQELAKEYGVSPRHVRRIVS
jgi:Mor family transcriptional regulator